MPRATALPPAERREQILDVTEPLLRQFGRKVSTRQIAEAAGVAEGTLFRVFDSKEDLIDNTVARAFSAEPTVAVLREIDVALGLEERLVQVATVMQNRLQRTFEMMHAIGPPPDLTSEEKIKFRDHMLEQNRQITEAIATLIEPDQDRLVLSPTQAAHLIGSMIMTVSHPILHRANELMRMSTDPRALVDLMLHGCLTDSTRTTPGFDHRLVEAELLASPPSATRC
jgi:AcrR family transcriptional regulator